MVAGGVLTPMHFLDFGNESPLEKLSHNFKNKTSSEGLRKAFMIILKNMTY
jgi:hypothetical protein